MLLGPIWFSNQSQKSFLTLDLLSIEGLVQFIVVAQACSDSRGWIGGRFETMLFMASIHYTIPISEGGLIVYVGN